MNTHNNNGNMRKQGNEMPPKPMNFPSDDPMSSDEKKIKNKMAKVYEVIKRNKETKSGQ